MMTITQARDFVKSICDFRVSRAPEHVREDFKQCFEAIDKYVDRNERIIKDLTATLRALSDPILMVLFCPMCGVQHIDRPSDATMLDGLKVTPQDFAVWTNPPHRSHLCSACGCVWRPSDTATVGVAHINTSGKNDTFDCTKPQRIAHQWKQMVKIGTIQAHRKGWRGHWDYLVSIVTRRQCRTVSTEVTLTAWVKSTAPVHLEIAQPQVEVKRK